MLEASLVRHLVNAEDDVRLSMQDAYRIDHELYDKIHALLADLQKLQIEVMKRSL